MLYTYFTLKEIIVNYLNNGGLHFQIAKEIKDLLCFKNILINY